MEPLCSAERCRDDAVLRDHMTGSYYCPMCWMELVDMGLVDAEDYDVVEVYEKCEFE